MFYKPVLLITDILFYSLIVSAIVFFWWSRRYEHWRAPWQYVLRNRLALVSLIILLFYGGIALLDSIHFRYQAFEQGEVISTRTIKSVLDILLGQLGDQDEKTYSAPFATHLYNQEIIETVDGKMIRDYPPLLYGGAHLKAVTRHRGTDIAYHAFIGMSKAVIVWLIIVGSCLLYLSKRYQQNYMATLQTIFRHRAAIPWRLVFVTIGVLMLFSAVAWELAAHYHILGTDKVGHDVFYESLKSIRTGLLIGTLTTLVMLPFAVIFGAMAGYFQGLVDDVIQYIYTTLSSIPGVLLIAAAVLSLQIFIANHPGFFATADVRADIRLLALCIILGITSWTTLCRLLRGETLKLREIDYVSAARALGTSHAGIMFRHILPNFMHIVLITMVIDFSSLVLAEAVLSYLGVGVDPSTFSWGNMINAARLEMAREPVVWWPLLAAFIFMFVLVLAANLFADVVRDAFDPRMKK